MKKKTRVLAVVLAAAMVFPASYVGAEEWTDQTDLSAEEEWAAEEEEVPDQGAEENTPEGTVWEDEKQELPEARLPEEEVLPEVSSESKANRAGYDETAYTVTEYEDEVTIDIKDGCTADDIIKALAWQRGDRHLTVNVPAGLYETYNTLYVYSNTTLNSADGAKYVLMPGNMKTLLGSYNWKQTDEGGYTHIQNVMISGGEFDGNRQGGEIVRFIHGSNISVKHAVIHDVGNKGHLLTLAGVDGANISGCEFYGYHGTMAKEALHLDVVHDGTIAPGTSKFDDAAPKNITVSGCKFHDLIRGVGSHSAIDGVFMSNIKIMNNTFTNITYEAIKTYNYKNLEIANNKMDKVGKGIFVHNLLKGVSLISALPGTVKEAYPSKSKKYNYNINIHDNTISNVLSGSGRGRGIELGGNAKYPLGGVTVTNNTIQKAPQYGIFLNTSVVYSAVSQNTVSSPGESGIVLYSSCTGNQLLNNTITYPKKFGISIGTSHSTTARANRVEYSGNNSIQVTKSESCALLENKIKSSRSSGISLSAGSHKPTISKNVIYNPARNAIYVSKCNSVRISGNTVQSVKKAFAIGVVDCSAVVTSYNKFTSTTQTPVLITRTKKANTTSLNLMKVNRVRTSSTKVTGTVGKTGSSVTIKIGKKTYSATVSKSRAFTSRKIPKQKKGTVITVTEKDKKGNTQAITTKVY